MTLEAHAGHRPCRQGSCRLMQAMQAMQPIVGTCSRFVLAAVPSGKTAGPKGGPLSFTSKSPPGQLPERCLDLVQHKGAPPPRSAPLRPHPFSPSFRSCSRVCQVACLSFASCFLCNRETSPALVARARSLCERPPSHKDFVHWLGWLLDLRSSIPIVSSRSASFRILPSVGSSPSKTSHRRSSFEASRNCRSLRYATDPSHPPSM